MGGVDKFDRWISLYQVSHKGAKWYTRIIYYLMDMTMVNAYIIYRKSMKQ